MAAEDISLKGVLNPASNRANVIIPVVDLNLTQDTENLGARQKKLGADLIVLQSDLGTSAALDVPTSGNAASDEVVKGDDTRLTNSRTPTSHTHPASEITQDSTRRFVTDTEKSTWNGKQDAIGYTPANQSDLTTLQTTVANNTSAIGVKTPQTLIDGATITWNVASGYNAKVTLGGNRALSITNVTAGTYGKITVIQDATGGRALTLPSGSVVVDGGIGSITLSPGAGAIDILTFFYDGTNFEWNYAKNYN